MPFCKWILKELTFNLLKNLTVKAACQKCRRKVSFFLFLNVLLQQIFAIIQLEKNGVLILIDWLHKANKKLVSWKQLITKTNLQNGSGVLRWFIFISLKSRKLPRQIQRDSENGRSDSTLIYILQSRGLIFGRRREKLCLANVLSFLWKSICSWWNTNALTSFCPCSEESCQLWQRNAGLASAHPGVSSSSCQNCPAPFYPAAGHVFSNSHCSWVQHAVELLVFCKELLKHWEKNSLFVCFGFVGFFFLLIFHHFDLVILFRHLRWWCTGWRIRFQCRAQGGKVVPHTTHSIRASWGCVDGLGKLRNHIIIEPHNGLG